MAEQPVLIQLKFDAFVFNKGVCTGSNEKTGESRPSTFNLCFTNLATEAPHKHRIGIYLHWTLPRLFRRAVAAIGQEADRIESFAAARAARVARGLDALAPAPPSGGENSATAPTFPAVRNRRPVIRHISDVQSICPQRARGKVPIFAAWVIKSNRPWELKNLALNVDLQTDVSPLTAGGRTSKDDGNNDQGRKEFISKQAEVFIGYKKLLTDWEELEGEKKKDENKSNRTAKERAAGTSDDAPTANICDNFQWGEDQYLTEVTAHCYAGAGEKDIPENNLDGVKDQTGMTHQVRLETLKLKLKLEGDDGKQVNDDEE
ncbi:hypothetical protein S40288_10083 [Stachybotrys chartarum IBT 40288]|nr:hypothetical protein S40288_10083 [Stachybotrys chartarum IBT 40288]